ncbi:hypothetical protein RJD24_17690 [Bacillaceae bacterium IKA-2]|nr:hypothetical protein RJD24_17690 [Bacillaceae bacterium IKA-2]
MLNNQSENVREEVETVEEDNKPLIGTWFSLGILLAVIAGTFVLMFSIFLSRV